MSTCSRGMKMKGENKLSHNCSRHKAPMASRNVFQLVLDGDLPQKTVYRVNTGDSIRFILVRGDPFAIQAPKIWTNYPLQGGHLKRTVFVPLPSDEYNGDSDWSCELQASRPGSFEFYLEVIGVDGVKQKPLRSNFVCEPVLKLNDTVLPYEGIVLQTVLTKCLGPLKKWNEKLESAVTLGGYNMFHFTPVQQLGDSGSAYSLFNQTTISDTLFETPLANEREKEKALKAVVDSLEHRGALSLIDVVWNHTANNTPWLSSHPEAGYSSESSVWMRMAFELDESLRRFSDDIVRGKVFSSSSCGERISAEIRSEEDLNRIISAFRDQIFPSCKFYEFRVVNVDKEVSRFRESISAKPITDYHFVPMSKESYEQKCREFQELAYQNDTRRRNEAHVSLDVALKYWNIPVESGDGSEIDRRCVRYRKVLELCNLWVYEWLNDTAVNDIAKNIFQRIKYERFAPHGPQKGPLTLRSPLIESYFVKIPSPTGIGDAIGLACNGWIYGGDPRVDFAGPSSRSYFLRDVIVWTDCVKLRYGASRDDSPWLWDHMAEYTASMARVFHAFRVDNCHSTPMHVAQYMLDVARRERENLYVTAELFTGSEEIDAKFVSQLGINSLIREAMSAWDPAEMSRQLFRYGGSNPVGAPEPLRQRGGLAHLTKLRGSMPGALLFDCTHDNETPHQKRSAVDALPNAVLVSMCACASGSSRGYDELVPRNVDVVSETRTYRPFDAKKGIEATKVVLNSLHRQMALEGFSQQHVHFHSNDVISIQRHNPKTHEAILAVVRCAYHPTTSPSNSGVPGPLPLPDGVYSGVKLAAQLHVPEQSFVPDVKEITGMCAVLQQTTNDETPFSKMCEIRGKELHFHSFPVGSAVIFKMSLSKEATSALGALAIDLNNSEKIRGVTSRLSLLSLNELLFRCEPEERDAGGGPFVLPHHGVMVYCGLYGSLFLLEKISTASPPDMGHPLCNNLREGNWLMDYYVNRLERNLELVPFAKLLASLFEHVKRLPRYLVPKYFDLVLNALYHSYLRERILSLLPSPLIHEREKSGDMFVLQLAMGSIQMMGAVKSAPLRYESNLPEGSLAAGLPFFSSGYMRNWGRDTFIALRGFCLIMHRWSEAVDLITAYGRCVRHGLIPNLLDGGLNPRYNSRDAAWWWLQAVQDYATAAPNGDSILSVTITKRFPNSSADEHTTVGGVVQEILQAHASGIHFRERNAGKQIDAHMTDQGFNIDIYLNESNGFVFGGNSHNCGTWMDKMGESDKAGNTGVPATPRDGAAVEIVGLLKSTVRWLSNLHSAGKFPHRGVVLRNGQPFSYSSWDALIKSSFEKYFYVPLENESTAGYALNPALINRRGIYKDTLGSSTEWSDYQFRPNICIAMAVAPEMFDTIQAQQVLAKVHEILLGPLGMKTLDPKDWAYRPDYLNQVDSEDRSTSKGFNYHQGPEWVWPVGMFLHAMINFRKKDATLLHDVQSILRKHRHHIQHSAWGGLPELTNQNGSFCADSCPTQAWSMATILVALSKLY